MRQLTKEESLAALEQLDLTMIRRKLMMPAPEGKEWSAERAAEAERWYRRFLMLMIKYPDLKHVPNAPIDAFWHQHILDTRKYATDCENIFGHFVHHFPYFGLDGDAQERDDAFAETNRLYRIEFGADCTEMSGNMEAVTAGVGCNDSGSGTGCGQGCSRVQ